MLPFSEGGISMPTRSVRDPEAEPLDCVVKLRLSARQLEHLDLAVKEFGMSRAWLLRECIAEGFPAVVEKVRQRLRTGLVPRGAYWKPDVAGPRRGPRSDGSRADRWVSPPARSGSRGRKQ